MRRKKRKKTKIVAPFLFVSLVGLSAGYWNTQPTDDTINIRRLSSLTDIPLVSYESLECPTEDEYRRVAAIVKLEVPNDIDVCAHEQHGKIARLFNYADKIKIQFAPDWAPALQEDLGSPLAFIGRVTNKMSIDLSNDNFIAYNKSSAKEIFLGGLFFSEEPLEVLSILIHEARHLSGQAPAHVVCRRSDSMNIPGDCDASLSLDPLIAGANSYETAFYASMGLYAQDLADADRKFMLDLALATASTRFNELPEELARTLDLIALLDENGRVLLLHPFVREPTPLALTFLKDGEKVERIEYDVRSKGLLLFTTEKRLFSWNFEAGFRRLFSATLPENLPIFEAARARVPFEKNIYFNFLTNENQIYFYRYQKELRNYELAPYPIFRRQTFTPEISRFFMALGERTIFLSKDGQFYLSPRKGDDAPFILDQELQIPERSWISGTGGVVFESLYGLTDDGRTHYAKLDLVPSRNGGTTEEDSYSLRNSSLQANVGKFGKKILEGVSLRALLDNEGGLIIENYGHGRRNFWQNANGRIVDFTIMRKRLPYRSQGSNELRTKFSNDCGVSAPIPDPWFGIGAGLNQNNELVVAGIGEQPCLIAGPTKYRSFRFQMAHSRGESKEQRGQQARTPFWVTTFENEEVPFQPYDFK